jgi:hypothetical protein
MLNKRAVGPTLEGNLHAGLTLRRAIVDESSDGEESKSIDSAAFTRAVRRMMKKNPNGPTASWILSEIQEILRQRKTWYYHDYHDNNIFHGPFGLETLRTWMLEGHFAPSMLITSRSDLELPMDEILSMFDDGLPRSGNGASSESEEEEYETWDVISHGEHRLFRNRATGKETWDHPAGENGHVVTSSDADESPESSTEVWEVIPHENGKNVFYKSKTTGEKTWVHPDHHISSDDGAVALPDPPPGWTVHEHGKTWFFKNTATNVKQWERPKLKKRKKKTKKKKKKKEKRMEEKE